MVHVERLKLFYMKTCLKCMENGNTKSVNHAGEITSYFSSVTKTWQYWMPTGPFGFLARKANCLKSGSQVAYEIRLSAWAINTTCYGWKIQGIKGCINSSSLYCLQFRNFELYFLKKANNTIISCSFNNFYTVHTSYMCVNMHLYSSINQENCKVFFQKSVQLPVLKTLPILTLKWLSNSTKREESYFVTILGMPTVQ